MKKLFLLVVVLAFFASCEKPDADIQIEPPTTIVKDVKATDKDDETNSSNDGDGGVDTTES